MAKYSIVYACGHEGVCNIYGKHDERQRKIEWLQTQDCPHCRNEKTLQEVAEYELPVLTGSEKQKAWASNIRANWIIEALKMAPDNHEWKQAVISYACSLLKSTDYINMYVNGGNTRDFARNVAKAWRAEKIIEKAVEQAEKSEEQEE